MLPSVVSVLSLAVATIAVLVTWANVRWQSKATVREAWMSEFRRQSAVILDNSSVRPGTPGDYEAHRETKRAYHVIRLLIAEKRPRHESFLPHLEGIWKFRDPHEPNTFGEEFTTAAADVLRRERDAKL
jgi:hypothetical protein